MIRIALAAAMTWGAVTFAADPPKTEYPPLPKAVSSFGAIECGGFAYVYGGHAGMAHSYSVDTTLGNFYRLPLQGARDQWQELPGGTGLQGLNLANIGGKIFRVGGMHASNKPGEKADLRSVSAVAVFDPRTKTWSETTPLPTGRSSHDVVAVGSLLVVVGGWDMRGPTEKTLWHETALVLDTAAPMPKWEAISQPFKRRALTAAALGNKVYVMGGLTESSETTRKVSILDVPNGTWSEGPEIPGADSVGFSPAATVVDNRIILSTSDKSVYALNTRGTAWDKVGKCVESRFVHRLVPDGKEAVLAIAGAGPEGPHATVERIALTGLKTAGEAVPPAPQSPAQKLAGEKPLVQNPPSQKFCPVMTEDEIDPLASASVDYQGVKIYLCCDQCVSRFKRDPAAYLDARIIPGLAGKELPKRDIEQVFCPVLKDRKVSSKDPSTTYRGVKVYFYNDTARQRFEKDPERYADIALLPQLKSK